MAEGSSGQAGAGTGPRVLVLNGPNLNLLGTRQPEIYGHETLAEIEDAATCHGRELGLAVTFQQTNSEGGLVDAVQAARQTADAIILNAAAYTHTSVALLDALLSVDLPVIEVHLSNPYRRESFRHHSFVAPAAKGLIAGLGSQGYLLALDALARILKQSK
ncbi:MAG: type II 3-dehydroquinate dehydratase [Sphingomonadales bacterium]